MQNCYRESMRCMDCPVRSIEDARDQSDAGIAVEYVVLVADTCNAFNQGTPEQQNGIIQEALEQVGNSTVREPVTQAVKRIVARQCEQSISLVEM